MRSAQGLEPSSSVGLIHGFFLQNLYQISDMLVICCGLKFLICNACAETPFTCIGDELSMDMMQILV